MALTFWNIRVTIQIMETAFFHASYLPGELDPQELACRNLILEFQLVSTEPKTE